MEAVPLAHKQSEAVGAAGCTERRDNRFCIGIGGADGNDPEAQSAHPAWRKVGDRVQISREFERPRRESDNTRDGFLALLVIGDHAAAYAERRRRRVERVGLTLTPASESVGR
jgi:hypothetical protein